jgi:hypothetical protein
MTWLKVERSTPDKPEVWAIAATLGLDPDVAFTKVFRVWAWFDEHTEDGNASGVTTALVDSITSVTGFGRAMQKVGWLFVDKLTLSIPHFDRHNGTTAKTRAATARRVARHKAMRDPSPSTPSSDVPPDNDDDYVPVTLDPLPEPLPREEKEKEEGSYKSQWHNQGERRTQKSARPARKPGKKPVKPRGKRLPDDWRLPNAWGQWAMTACGMSRDDVIATADMFADYWHAKPGASACKLDWLATWRVWCRRERKGRSNAGAPHANAKRERADLWSLDHTALNAMGRELGIGEARIGESTQAFIARIQAAQGSRDRLH